MRLCIVLYYLILTIILYEGPKIAYIEKCNSNCIVLYIMYLYVCTILQTCFIILSSQHEDYCKKLYKNQDIKDRLKLL